MGSKVLSFLFWIFLGGLLLVLLRLPPAFTLVALALMCAMGVIHYLKYRNLRWNDFAAHTFMKTTLDAVYCKDLKGNIVYQNKVMKALMKQSFSCRFFSDDEQVLQDGLQHTSRIELPGNEIQSVYEVSKIPTFCQKGLVTGVVGVVRDISKEQASLKEVEDAKQMKLRFLANMSHEIRTPLAAILGFTDFFDNENLEKSERKVLLHLLRKNAEHLEEILSDVLDLSKLEAGSLDIDKKPFLFREFLETLHQEFSHRAMDRGIKFIFEWDDATPAILFNDRNRLRQIIMNMIGNAIKFTDNGWVKVRVAFDSVVMRITIEDTGVGIEHQQQLRLFTPFMQSDESYTRQFSGTGLGLVLSQKIARALGGDVILIESRRGKGSKFLVTINVKGNTFSQPELPPLPMTSLLGRRILVADDSPDNLALVEFMLKPFGPEILFAENGLEAVQMARQNEIDLILMDLQMPLSDGFAAAQELRQSGFEKPIIALTANAMKQDREAALAAGFNDHLTKPVHKDTLIKNIFAQLKLAPLSAAALG